MSYKPSDFFFGVVDLFGVLLPGVLLAALLSRHRSVLFEGLDVIEPRGATWVAVAFLVAGYVLGNLLRALGEMIDRYIYDRFYVPAFKRRPRLSGSSEKLAHIGRAARDALPGRTPSTYQPDPLYAAAKEIADHDDPGKVRRNTFSWADSYVQMRSQSTHAVIERLTADSKFFRSLTIVSIVAAIMAAWNGALFLPVLLLLVALLSLYQFTRLRWKATNALYQAFVQLRRIRSLDGGAISEDVP